MLSILVTWQNLDELPVRIPSKYTHHIFNCRCMLDCISDCPKGRCLPAQIPLFNRFNILSCDDLEESSSELMK